MERAYLDHNATTPLSTAARDAMIAAMDQLGNPSSVHSDGRKARQVLDVARDSVAALMKCKPESVTFTSGATESNNTVFAHAQAMDWPIFISATSHASVLDCAIEAKRIPVQPNGVVDLEQLAKACEGHETPFIVSIEGVNNETGVIQPITEIAQIVQAHDGYLHVDAAQVPGKINIDDISTWGDVVTLSAHKFGGPKGVGATVLPGCRLTALNAAIRGGGQERRNRSGTENLVGIAGMGAAAANVGERLGDIARQESLLGQIVARISATPSAEIAGDASVRAANTLSIMHPSLTSEISLIRFDLAGVSISSGSACSSGKVSKSHVLDAMGYASDLVQSGLRISVGLETLQSDVDRFIAVWDSLFDVGTVHQEARAVA
ncbi:MAG: aminotransferase class V-fold PLP-dependent enzyme [Pseudomonadota bacterium]